MKHTVIIVTLSGFVVGLTAQFVWKMIYFPEPIIPVILELALIYAMGGVSIYCTTRLKQ